MTQVLRSLPDKTIARTLPVTLNTAHDHIKAIFAKTPRPALPAGPTTSAASSPSWKPARRCPRRPRTADQAESPA